MILSTLYSMGDPVLGMPTILETGFCTAEDDQLKALREYENEDVKLERVRRRSGIIAKSLTATAIMTQIVKNETIGEFKNCMQMGRTSFKPFAPRQPVGRAKDKMVLSYSRTWLHLGD